MSTKETMAAVATNHLSPALLRLREEPKPRGITTETAAMKPAAIDAVLVAEGKER